MCTVYGLKYSILVTQVSLSYVINLCDLTKSPVLKVSIFIKYAFIFFQTRNLHILISLSSSICNYNKTPKTKFTLYYCLSSPEYICRFFLLHFCLRSLSYWHGCLHSTSMGSWLDFCLTSNWLYKAGTSTPFL